MLNLAITTDKLALITSAAATVDVHASWVDDASGTFTAGKTNTAITTAATTDIVPVPGASTIKNIKFISIRNKDAAVTTDVTVHYNANATLYQLVKATLLAGEELVLREGVWFHYDTNGGVYGQALPVASDTIVGGVRYATQAEMEAASSTTLAVTPGRLKFHPGVAKATMQTTGTAVPVASTAATYNCTLTDTGVGQLTLTFTVAFSATTAYSVQVNVEIISVTLTAAANVMRGYMRFGGQTSASSCQVNCADWSATTNVIRDPISWHVVAFGDQ